jgi:hypothetical protein
MKLIEYRIFMPLTIQENQIGQLWSFAEVTRNNTGGGEGVQIAKNEIFDVEYDSGGHVVVDKLPFYESYETQISSSNSSSSNGNNKNNVNIHGSKSLKNVFKKSISKDNFNKNGTTNKTSLKDTTKSERRKSLESIVSSSSVEFNLNSSTTVSHNLSSLANHHTGELNQMNSTTDSNNNDKNLVPHGQFTHKLYLIASKLPWFVRKFLSKESTTIHERSWNMYPRVKTVLTNDFFRTNGRIEVDTITRVCVNGKAEENVHNLTPEQLEKREIVVIDIAEQIPAGEYKEDEDPSLFKSVKTGRGPLIKGEWINANQKPLICCYKLVFVEFKVFGLQTRAENYIKTMYKQLFTNFHRQIFCWIDKWHGLTLEDVRIIEEDLAKALLKKIAEGELSKNKLGDSE